MELLQDGVGAGKASRSHVMRACQPFCSYIVAAASGDQFGTLACSANRFCVHFKCVYIPFSNRYIESLLAAPDGHKSAGLPNRAGKVAV